MQIKTLMTAVALLSCATMFAEGATPSVSVASVEQSMSREVTVRYTLADAPAIITLDVYTNGVAVSQDNVWSISGDANELVQPGDHTLVWHPDKSWPNQKFTNGEVSIGVTAWSKDDPPLYLAANLIDGSVKYYTSEAGVPGGVTENPAYKTTTVLMRRIYAKDIPFTMGSASDEVGRYTTDKRENQHAMTLTHDYYIGVFPVTQKQWWYMMDAKPSYFANASCWEGRPVENVSYSMIRMTGTDKADTSCRYPNPPGANSFLGKLRAKTNVDFDLTSGAQWEYASRSGNGDGKWNDGSLILDADNDANLNRLGRNLRNGGAPSDGGLAAADATADVGTPIVGSYLPSSWGLYDMHGGVWELCQDTYPVSMDVYLASKAEVFMSGIVGSHTLRSGTNQRGAWRARSAFFASSNSETAVAGKGTAGFRLAVTLP